MHQKVKLFIFASLIAIFITTIFELIYSYSFMLSVFNNADHPWRYFGAFISAITGMALFVTPIFMRSKFDEDYSYALIVSASVASLFTINDILYYFVIDHELTVAELMFWILLEFLEYGLMGFVYVFMMKSKFLKRLLIPNS